MRQVLFALFAGLALSAPIAAPLSAAAQTAAIAEASATFAVDGMTCAACPITVRTAMLRVSGVRAVEVDFAARRARVVYDPQRATPAQIAEASRNVGYPARLLPESGS